MLSLSQNSNYFYFIEWIPSEKGPQVLDYKRIKSSASKNKFKNFLNDILINNKKHSINDSSSLSLSLDIHNVGITSIPYEKSIQIDQYIDWYKEKYLGTFINSEFDLYFYQIYNSDEILVIYINKKIKNNILSSCKHHKIDLIHLSIDFFSANTAASQVFGAKKYNKYIVWKIGRNNIHYLSYYEENQFAHYLEIKSAKDVECILSIGNNKFKNILLKLSKNILFNKKYNQDIQIFIYQNKMDSNQILDILSLNKKKIVLMDIGFKFLDKKKNKSSQFNLLSFNENGNSLRNIDV